MIKRILTGWNLQRLLFLIIGGFMVYQSFLEQQWIVAAIGGYFFSMGLFAFGCASGSCYDGSCVNETKDISNDTDQQKYN